MKFKYKLPLWMSLVLPLTTLASPLARAVENVSPLWECHGVIVRQVGPTSAKVGEEIRYIIHVANEGECDLPDSLLTDFIPRRTLFRSANPEPSDFPGKIVPLDTPPPPSPVEKIEWKNVHLSPSIRSGDFEVTVEIQEPANRVMTNTACIEHPKTGRICDTLDTYIKPAN